MEPSPPSCPTDVQILPLSDREVLTAPPPPKLQNLVGTSAVPQKTGSRECWATHWGITPSQLQELLERIRQEPAWDPNHSMYTLVNDFIKPWTRGTGMGYSLLTNSQEPKEVNKMVSHAWSENAEDFLEAVCRSCNATDVLFICAFAIYQVGDEFGPSIAEQLGTRPEDSPFFLVLHNIQNKGRHAGWRWRFRPFLQRTPGFIAMLGWLIYLTPVVTSNCTPTFTQCAYLRAHAEDWNDSGLKYTLHAACSFWTVAVLARLLLRCFHVYEGLMIVVPNRQDDLYTRLWCVYEIFVARSLGVPVVLGQTLASAGESSSAEAKCSSEDDKKRIRHDIEITYGKDKCYRIIDREIAITAFGSQLTFARVLSQAVVPAASALTAVFDLNKSKTLLSVSLIGIVMNIVGISVAVCSAFHIFQCAQGKPSWNVVFAAAGVNVVTGSAVFFLSFYPLDQSSGCSTSWGIATIAVTGLLICLARFLLHLSSKYSATHVVSPVFFWSWVTIVSIVLASLCIYHFDHGSTDSSCGFNPNMALFQGMPTAPWNQFAFCLSFYSAAWPVCMVIAMRSSKKALLRIYMCTLVIVVLLACTMPINVLMGRSKVTPQWYYCCAVYYALVQVVVVCMPLFGCCTAIEHWGLGTAEAQIRPVHLLACVFLLAAGSIQCYFVVLSDALRFK